MITIIIIHRAIRLTIFIVNTTIIAIIIIIFIIITICIINVIDQDSRGAWHVLTN